MKRKGVFSLKAVEVCFTAFGPVTRPCSALCGKHLVEEACSTCGQMQMKDRKRKVLESPHHFQGHSTMF